MKRIFAALLLILIFIAGCFSDSPEPLTDYSFSLTWGTYGISSYDSRTGRLVKTTDATNPEDYITTLILTEEQKSEIGAILAELDFDEYPEVYNPNASLATEPPMSLILTVQTGGNTYRIAAEDIAQGFESDHRQGQAFLDCCRGIIELLTESEEWKALPEYEFLYD